ncbi:hypothetical protein PR202_gb24493 [Eleusine coracana subsp. coracana]|uniref:Uncharacterized protein n=1 Tax=Eleusine coracana subsp. coracana TaxID=191504 RepID=A0AAV5FLS7_ELECO|nr:hypothetical protein PR202_gb24493 [Eleusine coracana subsp. coracana]
MALAVGAVAMFSAAEATSSGRQARRSRFLLANTNVYKPPLPSYECSKKSAAVCLAPGSPGPSCCDGQCVDVVASVDHCGGCNRCQHHRVAAAACSRSEGNCGRLQPGKNELCSALSSNENRECLFSFYLTLERESIFCLFRSYSRERESIFCLFRSYS